MVKLVLLFACLLTGPMVTAACRAPDMRRDFNNADIIFTGVVKRRIYETCNLNIEEGSGIECSGGEQIAEVEFDQIFKDSWDVRTSSFTLVLSGGSVEDARLLGGSAFLFFGNQISPDMIQVVGCGGATSIENAGAQILWLQKISEALDSELP